ncbi:hypothetical protein IIE18_10815 [Pseudomonas sp. V1]|uniref:hypothetical protein n=1 Tax=Pseudomonas arcuscaelestis TaxID=2710591 RepID=UPI00193F23BA|nr:hypothetical protein [Pseudomonas arcuscaelestis]MBM3105632.1 hypothetical protein [Pseudomonas arcuscaelestis]
MITETFLRVAYMAMTLFVLACALTTTLMLGKGGGLNPIEWFCLGSLWVAFIFFALLVAWATHLSRAQSKAVPVSAMAHPA